MIKERDEYALTRALYIIEAALEYFISIAVGTVYLANITSYIGIPDWITGIMTSFVSLGCGFQIIAVFIAHKTPVKCWVSIIHVLSQCMFSLMYFIPLLNISRTAKTTVLIITLFSAQIMHNAINSPKINWYMSAVDDKKRGSFTANKEIVSLIGGMVFSFALGTLTDYFENEKNMKGAFAVCGCLLIFLMGLHTLTLVFAKEKKTQNAQKCDRVSVKSIFLNKTLIKIAFVFVLWNIASYTTVSFMGTYQRSELGFTMGFSSLVIAIGSIMRALFSRPLGKFADRRGFYKMLYICFFIEAVAFLLNIFTAPGNGRVMYTLFHILYCIGCAGINSSIINLVYDYVKVEERTGAVAIVNTLSGFSGFFATLLISPLVSFVQSRENMIFGISVYAQQINSLISLLVTVFILTYLYFVIGKIKKPDKKTQG